VRGVSGHNGEHWSALAGVLGLPLELGDTASAEEASAAIEVEIDRGQAIFAPLMEISNRACERNFWRGVLLNRLTL
jgi:hypothetical protein